MILAEQLAGARLYDLEQPRTAGAPMHPAHVPPGFSYLLHRRHEPGTSTDARTGAAGVIVSSDHAGTHIDALAHQAENLCLYGGRGVDAGLQTSQGFRELGIDSVAPIVARGVLIDLGSVAPERAISLAEVQEAAREQAVEPRAGDVVLVRTGNGANWDRPADYLRGSGMAGEVSQWLADVGVRAVGADNVAWDWIEGIDPATTTTLPGHVILLVRSGIHILEHLYLEELAADRVREFAFVCLPLKIRGATGSPVRPIALV
ncbi:MAG TPA: cyclase family protein [Candidatus Dormibacteraeota bacterium]